MSYDDGRLKAAIEESYRTQLNVLCKEYYDDCLGSPSPNWDAGALRRFNAQVNKLDAARNELLKQRYGGKDENGEIR
jgi:hypothetical protein